MPPHEVIDIDSDPEDDVVIVREHPVSSSVPPQRRTPRPTNNGAPVAAETARSRGFSAGPQLYLPDRTLQLQRQPTREEIAALQQRNDARVRAQQQQLQLAMAARAADQRRVMEAEEQTALREAQVRRDAQLARAMEHHAAPFQRILQLLNRDLLDEDYYYNENEDPDYEVGMEMPYVRGIPLRFHRNFGDIPTETMQRIEADENQIFDQRIQANLAITSAIRQDLRKDLRELSAPFTSKVEADEDYVCVLCGVTLGEGIPEGFKPGPLEKPFAALQEIYDSQAPYQAVSYLTAADRDLSKRTFACACGHTYCGRCVNAIYSVKSRLPELKKRKMRRNANDINNPFVSAPLRCVAPKCEISLKGKKKFVELFL